MNFIYMSNNGWAIHEQIDIFSSDIPVYCVYRFYPAGGWTPFKQMKNSPIECFLWLYRGRFISKDEALFQIERLKNKDDNEK